MLLFKLVDESILYFLNSWALSSNFAEYLTIFFARYLIVIFFLFILWIWLRKVNPKRDYFDKKVVILALLSLGLAFILDQLLGVLVGRERPVAEYIGIVQLYPTVGDLSFPSSHAVALFAISASIFLSRYRRYGVFLGTIALVICVARIAAGLHILSDIIGGIIIGWIAAYIVASQKGAIYKFLFHERDTDNR